MAVLVRSGQASIPPLRRALAAAGVPVEVASDEVPLVRDPAVVPLLDGLRAVVNLDNDDPDSPDFLDPGRIESLLLSPLGGLDAGDLRALTRRLRARDKAGDAPRTSRELLRLAVVGDDFLADLDGPEVERCRTLASLLRSGAALLEQRASVEDVLWHLWAGTSWPERLRRQVDQGGAGARRAHKDLDSICALFEVTARAVEHRDHVGVAAFFANLVAQQIPGDTLAERGRAWLGRAPADRPPVQGAGVGARGGGARAAGGLAGPASPVEPAGCRPDRSRPVGHSRPGSTGHRAGVADGGAPPLLRRLHPRPQAARRHRREVDRRRRRAAVPVPRPSSRSTPSTATGGRRGRCRWAAWSRSCGGPSPTPPPRSRCARRRPGASQRSRRRTSAAASSCRRLTPPRGGGPAPRRGRRDRCATRSDRSRCRPACSRR